MYSNKMSLPGVVLPFLAPSPLPPLQSALSMNDTAHHRVSEGRIAAVLRTGGVLSPSRTELRERGGREVCEAGRVFACANAQ